MSLRLHGQLLAMNQTELEMSEDSSAKILLEIWKRNETNQDIDIDVHI